MFTILTQKISKENELKIQIFEKPLVLYFVVISVEKLSFRLSWKSYENVPNAWREP